MAGTKNDKGDGYRAALVNFRFMAHALWPTRHTVGLMREGSAPPVAARAAVNPTIGRLTGLSAAVLVRLPQECVLRV